jgi:MFS family permease
MVVLDNLVVSTALPVIRVDLGASIEQLEWIVNAYTFTFAVFLLMGAALGDRFGRKRMFMIGLAIFTGGIRDGRARPSTEWLHRRSCAPGSRRRDRHAAHADAPQRGVSPSGAARRSARGPGIAGFAVAMGPLVGGAVVEGISWHWIFWLNVPVGLILLPLATQLRESYGPDKALDVPGVVLGGLGLLGLVWGS